MRLMICSFKSGATRCFFICLYISAANYTRLACKFLGPGQRDVQQLQQYLKEQGFFPKEQDTTQYFGKVTQSAIQKFQCSRDIICSGDPAETGYGALGPRTRQALFK